MNDSKYRYEFCPFNNLTQHELINWNPFHGILGVWTGNWIIENNTFTASLYSNGDECLGSSRSTTVYLMCGDNNAVINVTEPSKCKYMLHFQTNLVCHPQSLLVYPRLHAFYQHKWDILETRLYHQEITPIGYKALLNDLFLEAGLKSRENRSSIHTNDLNEIMFKRFNDLDECIKAHNQVNLENQALKQEIKELTKKNQKN